MYRHLTTMLLLTALCACSIKTDRSLCPCLLSVAVEDGVSGPVSLGGWRGETCLFEVQDLLSRLVNGVYAFEAPRGRYVLSAYSSDPQISGGILRVPVGSQVDSVYAWSGEVSIGGDTHRQEMTLLKQFVTVYLRVESGGDRPDCRVLARGNVCGLDMTGMTPVEGEYACAASLIGESYYCFRLPRQKPVPDGVRIDVYSGGRLTASLNLSASLEAAGYDWTSPVLDDVHVVLDAGMADFTVGVSDWNEATSEEKL